MKMKILIFIGICIFSLGCAANTVVPAKEKISENYSSVRVVKVKSGSELTKALRLAKPGDDIQMADGTYAGKFKIEYSASGTAKNPIKLSGSRNVILDAGDINTGYVLYLNANYWELNGFSLTNGLKGLMTDSASYNIIDGLFVHGIGEEGIHLRSFSSNNTIMNVRVENTGLKTPDYGEGLYIGSAKNNWKKYSNGQADKCDNNLIENNHIGPNVKAECIDIKEGTTGGVIRNNVFDATGISGANSADSWIDMKGNNYVVEGNTGYNNEKNEFFKDGFQVHVAADGWGNNNIFRKNICNVNAEGYGFNIQLKGSNGTSKGNMVYADNVVNGAEKGVSNVEVKN